MKPPIDWLLAGPAYVEYQTRREFLNEPEDSPECADARRRMIADPLVQSIVAGVNVLPWKSLTNHKTTSHPHQLLSFLVEIGLKAGDGLQNVAKQLKSDRNAEGFYCVPIRLPKAFGGDDVDCVSWMLCDAPLTFYCLSKLGALTPGESEEFAKILESLSGASGFLCKADPRFGKFHGPGKKEDPCPYTNLITLKALSVAKGYENSDAVIRSIESILMQWENRREAHYYMFYMGTDFCKPKAPLVWFDIVHVLEVMSRFRHSTRDKRFLNMADILFSKADGEDKFTPESIYMNFKAWDIGQKKAPSEYLTFLIHRIYKRLNG